MTLLTAPQRAALEQALAMHVPGDDLPSCDPGFDFGAWQERQGAVEEALRSICGTPAGRYASRDDLCRVLLAADDRLRAAVDGAHFGGIKWAAEFVRWQANEAEERGDNATFETLRSSADWLDRVDEESSAVRALAAETQDVETFPKLASGTPPEVVRVAEHNGDVIRVMRALLSQAPAVVLSFFVDDEPETLDATMADAVFTDATAVQALAEGLAAHAAWLRAEARP